MISKVWITQQIPHLNYQNARRFGELTTIATVTDEIESTEAAEKFDLKILAFLDEYNPDIDHIVLSGDPAIIAAVMMAVGEEYSGTDKMISLLKWDHKFQKYKQINLRSQ